MEEIIKLEFDVSVTHSDLSSTVRVKKQIMKRFSGETAWSDAERYANDIVTKIKYGRQKPTA